MRRDTCNSSASLKADGAVRSLLSRKSVTSAVLRAGRVPEPEKMTSSIPDARMFLYELSPITQRNASTRLDLPQPFGPTTPVRPRSMTNSPGSTKDLKPRRRSRENLIGAAGRSCGGPLAPALQEGQTMPPMIADISSMDIAPWGGLQLMKKVDSTP